MLLSECSSSAAQLSTDTQPRAPQ